MEIVAYVPSDGNVSVGDTVNIGASVKVDSDRLWVGQQQLTVADTYEPVMVRLNFHCSSLVCTLYIEQPSVFCGYTKFVLIFLIVIV